MNTFGQNFRLTSFGESHGPAIGGVIDGIPSGIEIDLEAVQDELNRRRPGQSGVTTSRSEPDHVEILSGMMDRITLGTPIAFLIRNTNSRSADYDHLRDAYRPSHADFTYAAKFGVRDHRGGGRASARETAARVVAGAFARQVLAQKGIEIVAYTAQIASAKLPERFPQATREQIEANPVRCPDPDVAREMERLILEAKSAGDSLGGIVECTVYGVPAGIGAPVFGKLQARLAAAMMSIPAAKGFDYGMGFDGAESRGSEVLDLFDTDSEGRIITVSNNSGGIQGGISNGMPITMRVAFKPVASLMRPVQGISTDGKPVTLPARGRHDACVVPRAVPVVEAMAAITILDALLD